MPALLASSLAGFFLALAAIVMREPLVLLLLAAAAFGAYLSFTAEPLLARQLSHYSGLVVGVFSWLYLAFSLL